MSRKDKGSIYKHWESKANMNKTSFEASWGDRFALELEIKNISKYIKKGDKVLDVGCANGYSTFRHLEKKPNKIIGVDFSETMIKYAKQKKIELNLKDKIEFYIRDIRNLEFESGSFDITYTTRVLINLPNWQEQKKGIEECLRVTKKKGIVIFSEAFWEPLVLLNSMRSLKGMKPLVEPDFNRYLKMDNLNSFLHEHMLKFQIIDFSSIYYLGSRFLRELVTPYHQFPGYSNPINKLFFEIEQTYSGGGFGIQQAYLIYK